MNTIRSVSMALALFLFGPVQAIGGAYHVEDLRIPMPEAGKQGLEALLVRPEGPPGKFPLVILSHGSPRKADVRMNMTARNMQPLAMEFARRGWAAVAVLRRGYGGSGGPYVERTRSCADPDYVGAARTSAADLHAAIRSLAQRPDIDASRILAVGQSAGGLATVALTANPPPGLVAAISFAGGRGSIGNYEVCREDRLVVAFSVFGKTSRVPMLWVYTENDHYFAPPLAEKLRSAFVAAGGKVEFIKAASFGQDGHRLFSLVGIPLWTPMVDSFLAQQNLRLRDTPMSLDLPPLAPPPQLNERGRKFFDFYRMGAAHKAFAVSADGHFGWQTGRRTAEEAKAQALKYCKGGSKDCRIAFVDDAPVQ